MPPGSPPEVGDTVCVIVVTGEGDSEPAEDGVGVRVGVGAGVRVGAGAAECVLGGGVYAGVVYTGAGATYDGGGECSSRGGLDDLAFRDAG